jgi:glycerol-3-phosphate acyltransferase PlsY
VDLRAVGSGNVGATNVGRALGAKWGYLCFFLDVAKGLAPVLAAGAILRTSADFPTLLHQASWLAVGFGTIAGHVFSFYLRFRGGKGVATALGVVLGIFPYFTYAGLAAFAVWVAVTWISRYVSLGSVVAAAAFLPLFLIINSLVLSESLDKLWPLGVFAAAMGALIIVRHRANIRRLLAGTESKIGRKKQESA